MRLLSAQTEYIALTRTVDLESINKDLITIIDKLQAALREAGLTTANDVDEATLDRIQSSLPNRLRTNNDVYKDIRNTFTNWINLGEINKTSSRTGSMGIGNTSDTTKRRLKDTVIELSKNALVHLQQVPIPSEKTQPKRVYIPTLRGLRPLDEKRTDFYAARTAQDYYEDVASQLRPEIFTGLGFYEKLTELLLGNNRERKAIYEYQEFISDALFEGRSVALIPSPRTKVVVVKIGSEKEQPIYNLGDGIQSAIILSFLPYVTQEPTFFFIEEPEMYLHPGLQRKILDFFALQSRHLFFLTTHSNHLLDITIDIKDTSVFTFRKQLNTEGDDEQTPIFTIEAVDAGDNSSLELLGVRNSSVFLVNATVWVEGITDRWYLRKMLNSYMDHLQHNNSLMLRLEEDVHYSFVEYGGANITHWSFLEEEEHPIEVKRLCAKAILVIDKDGDTKLARKDALQYLLGDRLIILPCREVENLMPYSVIKQVVLDYERSTDLDIPDFLYDAFRDKYLGVFIEEEMLTKQGKRRGGYKNSSGTIRNKPDFCGRAIKYIAFIDLPLSTREVIQTLYKFLYKQNL